MGNKVFIQVIKNKLILFLLAFLRKLFFVFFFSFLYLHVSEYTLNVHKKFSISLDYIQQIISLLNVTH